MVNLAKNVLKGKGPYTKLCHKPKGGGGGTSQFNLTFFKVDSQNPKFSLEYLFNYGSLQQYKNYDLVNIMPFSNIYIFIYLYFII